MKHVFGEIAQLGFVVPDLDAALDHWIDGLRVGPFFHAPRIEPDDFVHRGEQHQPAFAAALANSGPMQIELVQPLDDTPSMWNEFLDAGREGLQHVAYWTTDFDDLLARATTAGYDIGHRGVLSGGRFAYLETSWPAGYAIELSEQSPQKSAVFGAIRQAAVGWDGSDPVRAYADLIDAAARA